MDDSSAALGSSDSEQEQVYCCDVSGNLIAVPRSNLLFSPAVYGVLIENQRVLLQEEPKSRLYHPPGGRIPAEQTTAQALRQHFRAATGLTPEVGQLLMVQDEYRLENNQGWHLAVMYYALDRPAAGRASLVDFDKLTKPEWVSVNDLKRADLLFGYEAIQSASKRLS